MGCSRNHGKAGRLQNLPMREPWWLAALVHRMRDKSERAGRVLQRSIPLHLQVAPLKNSNSDRLFPGLLNALRDTTILVFDREGRHRLLGASQISDTHPGTQDVGVPQELIEHVFPVHERDGCLERISKVFDTGVCLCEQWAGHLPDHKAWVEISLVPLGESNDEASMVLGVVRDITDRMETENELRQHRCRLQNLVERGAG